MEKKIITFSANEQQLIKTGGINCYASNIVAYIEAQFDLGANWHGFDSVRAVWYTGYVKGISTVLDSNGKCIVPYEVLTHKGDVMVNLVGSISDGETLTDRLTTCPVTAVAIKCNARIDADNSKSITPSEYEQFVATVKADADRAETGATASEQSAQNASESATASANSASDSAQSATASAQSAQNASESAISAENAKDDAEDARDEILGMRATAETLEAGSDATASYSDGLLTLGIPRGDKGERGIQGETGATPNFSIGEVDTLEPNESATATITGTAENPVLNLGIPKGEQGDVSLEDLEALLPTETASGEIVTITDGQSVVPAKSLSVTLEPIQSCTPWMGAEKDTTPYTSRTVESIGQDVGNSQYDTLVGGTIAWNQFINKANYASTETRNGITFTNNGDGSWTISGTATANAGKDLVSNFDKPVGHKEMLYGGYSGGAWSKYCLYDYYNGFTVSDTALINVATNTTRRIRFQVWSGQTVDIKVTPMFFDLTQLFGSTIADYIYSLEQANTGAGVAWFKKLFPNDYYPYDAGTLKSVQTSGHKVTDANDVSVTYPLDADLTLRGIPKLSDGKLYYDGDVYKSSGEVTRKYGIVDLGTLDWNYISTSGAERFYSMNISGTIKPPIDNNAVANIISPNYVAVSMNTIANGSADKVIACAYNGFVAVRDTAYTDPSAFKTAMSGVMLVYELATPTTESADPYTSPQAIYDGGTEKYIGAEIPVGHETTYGLVCPISGHTSVDTIVSPTTEAEDGTTYTTDLGQTVYGGTLDVVSGELVVDRAMVTFSNATRWSVTETSGYYRAYTYALTDILPWNDNRHATTTMVCDRLPTGSWEDVFVGTAVLGQTNKTIGFGTDSLGITDNASLDAWLANNPLTICYELATPQTIQLTPQEVELLTGTNNVWSDGNVTLVYSADIQRYIEKKLGTRATLTMSRPTVDTVESVDTEQVGDDL